MRQRGQLHPIDVTFTDEEKYELDVLFTKMKFTIKDATLAYIRKRSNRYHKLHFDDVYSNAIHIFIYLWQKNMFDPEKTESFEKFLFYQIVYRLYHYYSAGDNAHMITQEISDDCNTDVFVPVYQDENYKDGYTLNLFIEDEQSPELKTILETILNPPPFIKNQLQNVDDPKQRFSYRFLFGLLRKYLLEIGWELKRINKYLKLFHKKYLLPHTQRITEHAP